MAQIVSVGTCTPPHRVTQDEALQFARTLFQDSFEDIERLLRIFHNGEIQTRYFSAPLSWFKDEHSLQEKNDLYIKLAVEYGIKAIENCLSDHIFLNAPVSPEDIDAIFFISTTGMSTPSIEAKIMNHLPFSPHTKRIPIWGLGCAGGAAGLSRAYEYCLAYPDANVLVLSVELCSLTFQSEDDSKSNLVGTSLFADGAACTFIAGDESNLLENFRQSIRPKVLGTQSTLMPDSEDVMGWDIKDDGLFVVFSKSIPSLIQNWLKPNVEKFLSRYHLHGTNISQFIAHPGGKKVLEAYKKSLNLSDDKTEIPSKVLRDYGNMSSPTVLFVLKAFMEKGAAEGDYGLVAALGPGFSSELLLLEWCL